MGMRSLAGLIGLALLAASGGARAASDDLVEPPRRVTPNTAHPHTPEKPDPTASLILRLEISPKGEVGEIEILSCTLPASRGADGHAAPRDCKQFEDPARQAARQWKYKPITKNGAVAAGHYTVRVDFRLRPTPSPATVPPPSPEPAPPQ
jgi:hypothetical protein